MTNRLFRQATQWVWHLAIGCGLLAVGACSALRPATSSPPAFYSIDGEHAPPSPVVQSVAERALPTLLITTPHAAAGYDSQRIIYVREDHKLAYFAHSEWVDSPARMLGPLLMATIEKTRAFGAVVSTPANAAGDLRLDTQIIRLQHNFQTSPSRVQFTLRAYLTDEKTRRVLAWREFNGEAPATRETAQGGVNAANLVVQDVMTQLAQFLALPR